MAEEIDQSSVLARSTPIHRSESAGSLRASPQQVIPRSASNSRLQDAATRTKMASPSSAKSDISKHKLLPPIKAKEDNDDIKATGRDAEHDEFASVTESELGDGDGIDVRPSSQHNSKAMEAALIKKLVTMETQTDWSWIETMKVIQQTQKTPQIPGTPNRQANTSRQSNASRQPQADNLDEENAPPDHEEGDGDSDSIKAGRVSAGSKASRAGTQASHQSSKRKDGLPIIPPEGSTFIALSPSGISAGSIAGAEGPPEVMTTLVLPYKTDEYGVPLLQFSDTDSESESEMSTQKNKTNKTLPSVGPPQILKFKRDVQPGQQPSSDTEMGEETNEEDKADSYDEPIGDEAAVNDIITFKGECDFCKQEVKPFPTLHQQQILPPEELYCCEEFATFVKIAVLPPAPNAHLIDIKPHRHYGSRRARDAAREKAQARIRDRDTRKSQVAAKIAAKQEAKAAAAAAAGASGAGGAGGGTGGQGGQGQNAQQMGGAGGGGPGGNMFASKIAPPVIPMDPTEIPKSFKEDIQNTMKEFGVPLLLPKLVKSHPNPAAPTKTKRKTRNSISKDPSASELSKRSQKDLFSLPPIRKPPAAAAVPTNQIMRRVKSSTITLRSRAHLISPAQAAYEEWINSIGFARQMKTINFQLSSQKCIDDGYVIKPESPSFDDEEFANPFEIEPVEWYSSIRHRDGDADLSDDYDEDWESAFDAEGKLKHPKHKRECVERYYPDGAKFLTMFPDGTGNVFYSNGQVAISVSCIEPGKFTYLVYDAQPEEGQPQQLLAEFEPDAVATCYHKSGGIRLFLDQLMGLELNESGAKKKKWSWLDEETHTHAPPVQPLCFALNKYIGVRVMSQDNIAMTFLSYQRSCRFNVGVKLKLVHPENLPLNLKFDDDQIYMNQKSNHISGLLQKIENLLKYPHSSKAKNMPVPKRVTIKAEKLERYKQQASRARIEERERRSKKFTRTLSPVRQSDSAKVLITETGDMSAPQTQRSGRQPKYAVVVN